MRLDHKDKTPKPPCVYINSRNQIAHNNHNWYAVISWNIDKFLAYQYRRSMLDQRSLNQVPISKSRRLPILQSVYGDFIHNFQQMDKWTDWLYHTQTAVETYTWRSIRPGNQGRCNRSLLRNHHCPSNSSNTNYQLMVVYREQCWG